MLRKERIWEDQIDTVRSDVLGSIDEVQKDLRDFGSGIITK